MLLSDGQSTDLLPVINDTIIAGKRRAGKVHILAFGLNTRGTYNFAAATTRCDLSLRFHLALCVDVIPVSYTHLTLPTKRIV